MRPKSRPLKKDMKNDSPVLLAGRTIGKETPLTPCLCNNYYAKELGEGEDSDWDEETDDEEGDEEESSSGAVKVEHNVAESNQKKT